MLKLQCWSWVLVQVWWDKGTGKTVSKSRRTGEKGKVEQWKAEKQRQGGKGKREGEPTRQFLAGRQADRQAKGKEQRAKGKGGGGPG